MLTCPLCGSDLVEGELFGGEPVFACKLSKTVPPHDPLSKNFSAHYIRFGQHSDFAKLGLLILTRKFSDNTTKIKYDGNIICSSGETPFNNILPLLTKWNRLLIML